MANSPQSKSPPEPGDARASEPSGRVNGGRSMIDSRTLVPLALVLVIVTGVLGGAGAWFTLAARVERNCEIVNGLDNKYVPREVLEEKLGRIEERQTRMEKTLDAVATKLGAQ